MATPHNSSVLTREERDRIVALLSAGPAIDSLDEIERDTAHSAYQLGWEDGRAMDAETVICCDCARIATGGCEHAGHGLETLGELIDCYSNPR